jgi:hypothetical protein
MAGAAFDTVALASIVRGESDADMLNADAAALRTRFRRGRCLCQLKTWFDTIKGAALRPYYGTTPNDLVDRCRRGRRARYGTMPPMRTATTTQSPPRLQPLGAE